MKIIGFMNGWTLAPHCWRRYLMSLPKVKKIEYKGRYWYHEITFFGFVLFVENSNEIINSNQ
jgi:hypothetical protein